MKKIHQFILFLLTVILIQNYSFAQKQNAERLNNYKYIVIPIRFEFQSKDNQYLINSRVKYLLEQRGFNTVVSVEKFPTDLAFNRCLGLNAELKSLSDGFLSMHTELQLILKNCHNEVVFKSEIGESRIKDMADSYKDALREVFKSFDGIQYAYNGSGGVENPSEDKTSVSERLVKTSSAIDQALKNTFWSKGESFKLKKIEAGYLLYNAETEVRIALLHKTENGAFLYNSKSINGTADISKEGKLITVEYFDTDSGKLAKLLYKAQ